MALVTELLTGAETPAGESGGLEKSPEVGPDERPPWAIRWLTVPVTGGCFYFVFFFFCSISCFVAVSLSFLRLICAHLSLI